MALVRPGQAALLAIDLDGQAVAGPGRDLRGDQHPARPAAEAQQHVAVVVQRAARHYGGKVGAQPLDPHPAHELGDVEGVHADVADRPADPGLGGVGPPAGLLVAVALDRPRQPALRVLDDHLAHRAQVAAGDDLARLADHRIAGIDEGQAIEPAGFRDHAGQVLRLRQVQGRRLVADHVHAGLQRRGRHLEVQVVGRHHRHQLRPVGPRGFRRQHLAPVAIGLVGRHAPGPGGLGVLGAVAAERARDQLDGAVQFGRHPMHRPDE